MFAPSDRRWLVVGVIIALVGPVLVTPLIHGGPLASRPGIAFLLVVVVATLFGRLSAAILAIAISSVLLDRYGNPALDATAGSASIAWAILVFILVAVIITLLQTRRDAQVSDDLAEGARLRLLALAGDALSESLDVQETLSRLGDVIVPALADWFSVDLVEDGSIRNVVVMHPDPTKVELARELQHRFPTDPDAPSGAPNVIRTGRSELTGTIPDEMLEELIDDPTLLKTMRSLGLRCAMVVPLTARGKTIGAISLLGAETHGRYGPADLQLAEEIADRAALAIDTARLFAAESAARAAALEEARRSEILKDVTAAFGSATTTDEVLSAMLREGIRPAGAKAGTVALVEGAGWVVVRGVSGYEPDDHRYWYRFHLDERLPMSEAIVEGRPVVVSTTAELNRRYPTLAGRGEVRDHALACVPLLLGAEPIGAFSASYPPDTVFDDVDLSLLRSIGEQCAQALDRVRALERAARARARLDAVAAASRALARSLDFDETIRAVMALAVEHMGTSATLWQLGNLGPEILAEVGDPRPAETSIVEQVASGALGPGPFAVNDGTPSEARIILPLSIAGTVSGVLVVGCPHLDASDDDDLDFAAEIARRMTRAIENARLYRERDYVARTLQRGLLPTTLPDVPGLEIEALFLPAGAGRDIGGDLYDVFETADGRWAVVVGDVCGKGVEAATLTGMVRHMLRAFSDVQRPSQALQALNRALLRESLDGRFCTVALLLIDPSAPQGVHVTLASGGHPLPQQLTRDGRTRRIGEHGTLLGVIPDVRISDVEVTLGAGDAVLIFTDGIIAKQEASGEEPQALLRSLRGRRWDSAAQIRDAIEEFIHTFDDRHDDIAVLVLRAR